MKNKGFTLIELLAVIVILAIIALIATPIILNIINDSGEESNKRSIDMYAKAIENAIAVDQLEGTEGIVGTFNTTTLEEKLNVEYDGKTVVCDTIKIHEDGSIYLADCSINGKPINYQYGTNKIYANGDIVYFDIKSGKGCTNYHEDNSQTGYNGLNPTGNQTNCLKFYAFLDDGGETLNLLLDHNTTAATIWTNSSTTTNVNGPINLLTAIYNDTKNWSGTEVPNDYEVSYGEGYANYTIDYDNLEKPYKARIIEATEIAQIIGYENFDGKLNSSIFFQDKSTNFSTGSGSVCAKLEDGCTFGWLYDRISTNCESNGCFNNEIGDFKSNGYWISTASIQDTQKAWYVVVTGAINSSSMPDSLVVFNNHGVRPVIEVLKSNL